jgi:hypothetical protein
VFFLKTPPWSSQFAALRWWWGRGTVFVDLCASGENLRSVDRAVTALSCRVLLEDVALELTVFLRMMLALCLATIGKACAVPCVFVEFPGCCLLGSERRWSMHSGGRSLVALPAAGSSVDGVRVRWLSLG